VGWGRTWEGLENMSASNHGKMKLTCEKIFKECGAERLLAFTILPTGYV
jgi:hypothetical protein